MKSRLPTVLAIMFVCFIHSISFAQTIPFSTLAINYDTLRIMDYNLLNYPGSTSSTRNPYFRAVIHSAKPDVIVTLENTSQSGVNEFLNSVLNYYQPALYSTISFNDGPDTDPHIFYKSSKVTFLGATYFLMSDGLRNFGVYKIKVNASGDTLSLYAVHLKASQGFETNRLTEATQLRDTLNNLLPGAKFMVMGDYNFYTATEPAFTKLTESETDNDGRLKDPINQIGNWHDGSSFAPYHTQSTRTTNLGDGGATGGLDDRFDFILTSYSSLDSNTIVSSYKAYGNDGNHFNQSINVLPNTAVPESVANGVYYSSDHLPVVCNFKFEKNVGQFSLLSPLNSSTGQAISGVLRWQSSLNAAGYDVYLDQNNPPTTVVSSNQVDTIYSYTGLMSGATYYWKVVAKNGAKTTIATVTPWNFSTISGNAPASFLLLSPSDSSVAQPLQGTLKWRTSAYASQYDVYLDTLNPPNVKVSIDQIDTSYNYSGLLHDRRYYWKVTAKNINGYIDASGSPSNFVTIINGPGAFSLTSPVNNEINHSIDGTLIWESSLNATSYDVYLDENNPPSIKVSAAQIGTSYNFSGLAFNTTYYWKVIARNIADSIIATAAAWKFTTIVAAPSAFQLLSPTDTAIDQPLSGTLTWETSANATSYDIYLDVVNPPHIKVDSNISGAFWNYSNKAGGTTYYWKVVAGNISGTMEASNSPRSFTTMNVPAAPSNLTSSDLTESSLKISWTDNATNEVGYRVYRAASEVGPFVKISGDLPENSFNFSDTGLAVNFKYYYHIVPFNNTGEGNYAGISVATLASVPEIPTISDVSYQSLKAIINPWYNPSSTQFAIKVVVNDTIRYVHPNGTLVGIPQWQTYTQWGGTNGIIITALLPCQIYAFSVTARNIDNIETQSSMIVNAQMPCNIISSNVVEGWNLISIPSDVDDSRLASLFPSANSQAFAFHGSYIIKDTLTIGNGYWIKFNSSQAINITGQPRMSDTIKLNVGWNIVGSLAVPISTNSINTEPAGILSSSFFQYDGIYTRADSLYPVRGYWIKANAPGNLILHSP